MGELDGKVAIVTGAGRLRGLGRATSVALARLGADVVVTGTGRHPDTFPEDEKAIGWKDVEGTCEQIEAEGRKGLPLVVDVADAAQVQAMVDKTMAKFGRVDILVNNAAYAMAPALGDTVDLEPEMLQKVLDVKVIGTLLCSQAVLRQMIKQGDGGNVVHVSSVMGKRGMPNSLAYTAASFAVVGMTQTMAREVGQYGINVNCVCPGTMETSRQDYLPEGEFERRAARGTTGRNGTEEEVGAFIGYLCTKAASWIAGQSININGGTVMEH